MILPVCVANPRAVNVKAVTSLRFSQDARMYTVEQARK